MLALCHCNFDLDQTVVFITGNGFLTSSGAKLNPIQGLSDGDGSAEMAAMKDKLAKVEAEKEALATRSADHDRLLNQEKLKVERLEEQINRGTVRRASLAISRSPTPPVPKASVPDKDLINAMIQLNKELMELKVILLSCLPHRRRQSPIRTDPGTAPPPPSLLTPGFVPTCTKFNPGLLSPIAGGEQLE